ncbi:two-component regulator propeller domain-containing protein [Paludibacter sp.]
MRKVLILNILLILINPVEAFDDIYFSKIGIEQGLSQLTVTSIYQDELGIIWFGTREGVSRYNGNSMEVIKPILNDTNSLSGNLIRNICGDKNGNVFIHSQNGLNMYEMKSGRMTLIQRNNVDAISYGVRSLWIAEGNKLFEWQKGSKSTYLELSEIQSSIKYILQASDQRIFVGTLSSGLYVIDQNKKYRILIPSISQVSYLFEDTQKNIWVSTWNDGLYKIDRSGSIKNFRNNRNSQNSLSSNFVRTVCQDNKGYIWIGTRKGLDRLHVETESFTNYNASESSTQKLSNESVWSLFKDYQGTIWVGTYFGGVNYFYPDVDSYTFHNLNKGLFKDKAFPIISEIIEEKNGNLLLCSEGDGLIIYNTKTKLYKNIRAGENGVGLSADNIKIAYYEAENDILWLGMHLGGITRVNLKNYRTDQIRYVAPLLEQSDIVRAIVPFNGDLLIATYNGLFILDRKTLKISLFSDNLQKKLSYFVDVIPMGDELWIASRGLFRFNTKTGDLKSYFHDNNKPESLIHNNVTKLLVDSKSRLWIGTNGGGVDLYNPSSDSFTHYNSYTADLNNDYVSNIMESKFGYIFIATTIGLTKIDVESNKTYNYDSGNGFPLNSLYNGGMTTTKLGEMFVAGMNGLISFNEENLTTPQQPFNLNFVNMWVNNKQIFPGDDSNILPTALPYIQKIKLNYKQSMLTVEFAANNYIGFNKPFYRYRLEGLSNDWTELPMGLNKLNFLNLNPGKYRLQVQAISSVNKEPVANTYLQIIVAPPFYKSWYAYLLYILLIIFLVWRYVVFIRSKLILKTSLEYEKKEKAHIEEVNKSKLRFFTNISHEFRTPLTLISGQVDMLLQMSNIQPTVYNRILNIKRNTLNMQNLISELLEFRKSEQGHLSIKVSQQDIVEFIYEIYLSFSEYAEYRNIKFNFEGAEQKIMLWFDPNQMQKVFYNLISNAFKYTSKNGSITLNILENADSVVINIIDSGIGIDSGELEKIFDRFYQAENGLQINNMTPGTGIGLALTKNIIELHKAKIKVESTKGVGTQFVITLRKGNNQFDENQIVTNITENKSENNFVGELDSEFLEEMKVNQLKDNEPLYSMLIVEDNDDLREMLKQLFEPIYKIYIAENGEEGLKITLEQQPDIVLSDLMMPVMSGSEMCSKIKENFMVCHIPVVLLTAQTAIEYNIEGLRLGADDYITKPFNVKTLITRCNNLVNNRKVLQEKFSKQIDSSPRLVATNQLDREFLEKAQRIVESNLDNSEFDVQMFAREMALGRTNLFNKIKGITGQTPNDFILNVRLKKAADWLTNNPEYNISDVTYMLGFSSPKYFSKCFKDLFGVSPSSFRKGLDEEDVD